LETGDRRFLIDCGPATTYKLVQTGMQPLDIDHLFFTHHHFDHTSDFATFLLTRWDHSIGEENRLKVFGPSGTEVLTDRLIGESGAFSTDWKARVGHHLSHTMHVSRGGSLPRPAPSADVTDATPGPVHSEDGLIVTAAPGEHVQPFLDSLVWRLETPDCSVVFTGDTQPCDRIVDLARGADALVSLCGNFQSALRERGIEEGQTGTLGAAEMAAEAGVKQLFLVHVGPDLSARENRERGLAEIASVFDGEVVLTDELTSYEIMTGMSDTSPATRDPVTHPHIHRH
jgi:ribonuclease BN (tRNA processing enzyme)